MPSINKAVIIGHVGFIKELQYTQGGSPTINFSVATRRNENTTDWHQITAYRNTAENAAKYIDKGDLVYVEGQITYDVGKDGKKYTNIIAFSVWNLSSKGQRRNEPASQRNEKSPDEDLIPF